MTSQHNQEEMLHGSSRGYTPSGGPELGVFAEEGRGGMTLKDVKSSGVALARHAQKKPLVPFIDFGARTTPMWYKATVVDKYHRLCVIRKP